MVRSEETCSCIHRPRYIETVMPETGNTFRAVIKWGYYEHGPQLLSKENKRKIEPNETPSCLIPCLLVVFTLQLEILVTSPCCMFTCLIWFFICSFVQSFWNSIQPLPASYTISKIDVMCGSRKYPYPPPPPRKTIGNSEGEEGFQGSNFRGVGGG